MNNNSILGPLIGETGISSELTKRKSLNIFKTVKGSTRKLIAEKVKLEIQKQHLLDLHQLLIDHQKKR